MHAPHQTTAHLPDDPKVSSLYFPNVAQPQTICPPSALGMYCPRVDVWSPSATLCDAAAEIPLLSPFPAPTYPHYPSPPYAITAPCDADSYKTPVQPMSQPAAPPAQLYPHQHPRQPRRKQKYRPVAWSPMGQRRRPPLIMNRPPPPPPPPRSLRRTSTPAASLQTSWATAVVNGSSENSAEHQTRPQSTTPTVLAGPRLIPHHASSPSNVPTLASAATGHGAAIDSDITLPGPAPKGRTTKLGNGRAAAHWSPSCARPRTAPPSLELATLGSVNPFTTRSVEPNAMESLPPSLSPSSLGSSIHSSASPVEPMPSTTENCTKEALLWSSIVKRGDERIGTAVMEKTPSSSSSSSKSLPKSSVGRDCHISRQLKWASCADVLTSNASTGSKTDGFFTPPSMTTCAIDRKLYTPLCSPLHASPPSPPPLNITPPALTDTIRSCSGSGSPVIDSTASYRRTSGTSIRSSSGGYSTSASEVRESGHDYPCNTLSWQTGPVSPASKGESWTRCKSGHDDDQSEKQSSSELCSTGDEQHAGRRSEISTVVRDDLCDEHSTSSSSYSCCCGDSCEAALPTADRNSAGERPWGQQNIPGVHTGGYCMCDERVGVVQFVCGVSAGEAVAALKASNGDVIAAFEVALSMHNGDRGGPQTDTGRHRDGMRRETKSGK